jgi:hypothetical protein
MIAVPEFRLSNRKIVVTSHLTQSVTKIAIFRLVISSRCVWTDFAFRSHCGCFLFHDCTEQYH